MSWLAPVYLAGLLTVAGPIVFHLWRRTPQGRRLFSTLMFLSPSPPRITRRSRIEQWLLLCLRALACILLALAFARPVLRVPAEIAQKPRGGELLAVLVDTSASVRRADLWPQIQAKIRERIGQLTDDDTAALFAYDNDWTAAFSFREAVDLEPSTARAVLLERLAALQPSWGGTVLGEALVRTAQVLQEAQAGCVLPRPQRILLLTDLAEGSRLDGLQNFDWPRDIPVELAVVSPVSASNAGVQYVAASADLSDEKVRVRVTNAARSAKSEFYLRWLTDETASETLGSVSDLIKVHVPPGQNRVVALPDAPAAGGAGVELTGDDHPFDNRLWLPFRQPQRCTVLYVGRERADDVNGARFYWERALASNPRYEVRVVTAAETLVGDPPTLALVTHLGEPKASAAGISSGEERDAERGEPDSGLALLPRLLSAGRQVVLAPGSSDDLAAALAACGVSGVGVQESSLRDYALWSEIDFESPWFAPFAESQFADFSGVHFWKHRRLSEPLPQGGRVLVRFDDRTPAVVELPVQNGRVWCFASGWHPSDSQLARSTKFVPLMWRMLEHALGDAPVFGALSVGQPLPSPRNAENWTVTPPDGKTVAWTAAQGQFAQTVAPGKYTLQVNGQQEIYAVNVPPDESRTDPLPPEQLESYGVRLSTRPAVPEQPTSEVKLRQQQLAELEQHQQLWRWAIAAAVLLLLIETIVAAWKSRRAEG